MFRFILSIIGVFAVSSVAQAAVYLHVHCPLPHKSKTYNNQYVYIETVSGPKSKVKPIKPIFKLTNAFGVVKLPNKYKNQRISVSVSAPAFPPKKTAIPGCSSEPKKLRHKYNKIHFSGGLTEDCGIVNVKSVCKP